MRLPLLNKVSNKYGILVIGSITFFLAIGLLFFLTQKTVTENSTVLIQAEQLRTNEELDESFVLTQLNNPVAAWNEHRFVLIDIRSTEKYEASHLTGARSVPVDVLGSSTIDPSAKVVIYSEDSLELKQAEILLKKLGVMNIFVLQDPLALYKEHGYAVYEKP